MSERLGAVALAETVLDTGSFQRWDTPIAWIPPEPAYAEAIGAARRRTGLDESVITGEGRVRGRRVAVVVCEFGFLAGSIGVAAADRLASAIERATAEGLPLLAAPASGGTRMQEGTLAFVQMIKISAAVTAHRAAGLPYLVYLRDPTTGGVFASWGSLGHVTAAEPGARIGFLGARVFEALYGTPFPVGVQIAENLHERGLIDAVIPVEELAVVVDRVLRVLSAPHPLPDLPEISDAPVAGVPAWESIERSRRRDRPGVRDVLRLAATAVTPLEGTGAGEREQGLVSALAKFGQAPCIVLGHDRSALTAGAIGPAGLREARRGFRLAAELGLPLVTMIDTAGAALSKEAEEGGLAGEIARCLSELVTLSAPTVCVLLGQGAGGAALALLPADRVIAAEHAWLSPLPPEGASAIMYRSTDRAAEVAQWQGVRSVDLLRDGVVDRIVTELPDAADEPAPFARRLGAVLESELTCLLSGPAAPDRSAARIARYRRLGSSQVAPSSGSATAHSRDQGTQPGGAGDRAVPAG